MTWQKCKSISRWFATNAPWWVLAIYGTVYKSQLAFNLFAFFSWILFLAAVVCIAAKVLSYILDQPMDIPVMPVPKWVDRLTDLFVIILVVAFGHWFYGALITLHSVLFILFFEDIIPS
jgi:hypothetical protein